MSTQRQAFDPGPGLGNMSDKEQAVFELLLAHPDGVRSTDVGVHIHVSLSVPCACSSSAICRWAFTDGERVGKQLRKRGVAIKRMTGLWELLPAALPRDTGTFPSDF